MKHESIANNLVLKCAMAEQGSKDWAEYCKTKLERAVDHTANAIYEFASELPDFWQHEAWSLFTDESGKPFASFHDFATTKRPHGLGCSEYEYTFLMNSEDAARYISRAKTK